MKPIRIIAFFALGIGVFLTSGCVATQDDVGGLYARQNRLEARVERLSREMGLVKTRSLSPNSGSREVNEQVFKLESKIFDLEQTISNLNRRISELEEDLQITPPTVTSNNIGSTQTSEQATTTPDTTQVGTASDFDKGYASLSQGNYDLARSHFRNFLKNSPSSPRASDATFWIADSYYREGHYEEAILEYQKLIDNYPRDSRVPLAYLKQGLSLININRNEEAKLFLQTLIDRYPSSQEADEARKKILELEAQG